MSNGSAETPTAEAETTGEVIDADSAPTITEVVLSEPVQHDGGTMKSFVTYQVDSTTATGEKWHVVRRYSDYVWLRAHLVADHPGVVVPALPGKTLVPLFTDEFLDFRMRELSKFLNKVVSHGVLSKNPKVVTFLQDNEAEGLGLARGKGKEAAPPAVAQRTAWSGFASKVTSLVGITDDDSVMTDSKVALLLSEAELPPFSYAVEKTMHQRDAIGKAFGAISKAVGDLAQVETHEGYATALTELVNVLETIQTTNNDILAQDWEGTQKPLIDLVSVNKTVHEAHASRNALLLDNRTHSKNLAKAKVTLDAAKAGGNDAKKEKAQTALDSAQEILDESTAKLADATKHLKNDIQSYSSDKSGSIQSALLTYVRDQIALNDAFAKEWEGVIGAISAVAVASPTKATSAGESYISQPDA